MCTHTDWLIYFIQDGSYLFFSFLVNSFDKSLCTTPLDGVIEQLDLEPLGKHISWLRKVFMKENDIARKYENVLFLFIVL